MNIGFIGTGNMGSALVRAVCKQLPAAQVLVNNRTPEKAQALCRTLGCVYGEARDIAARADFLFLGVKPAGVCALVRELAPSLKRDCVLVSMAASVTLAALTEACGGLNPVIRIMPNTPVSVGEGMVLIACGETVSAAQKDELLRLLASAGRCTQLPEALMDAGSAVSGCGPAFADLFLEALADGGVACGLPRAQAQLLAAQMLLGAAKLALETGEQPGVLKDAVCSPGGTTIEGVRALERNGFRSAVLEAVIASYRKSCP